MSELSKEDKQFLINITLLNRQFLVTLQTLMLSLAVALTSLIASIFALLITFKLEYKVLYGVIGVVLILGIWIHWYILYKKNWPSLKNTNEQYQKYFFEVYPSLKDTQFYH